MGGFGSTNSANTQHHRIKSIRISNDEVILLNKTKKKIRRMARPITNLIIHPNDKRHHNSPHRQQIDKNKENQYPANTYNLRPNKDGSISDGLDMHIPVIDIDGDQQDISSTTATTPLASSVNKVNSSQPKTTSISHADHLRSIGFLKTENLRKYMPRLGLNNFNIQRLPRSPKLDEGETATMNSNRRNKTTLPIPATFSSAWNIDIGFGPCTAIGGIKYTLLAVNKKTRLKLVYGLTNLKC
jgi:hypothetical protein